MQKDRQMRRLIVDIQQYMSLYGYQMVSTPIIEPADLFLTKAGDQIAEHLFTFDRHGHNLALRPEFTASAAYLYTTQKHQDIVRWQFNGSVFEDDPEDDSEHYQQYSIGAELIGMHGAFAEAEIIGMAVQGLVQQGITNWQLVIGHAGLTRHLLEQFNLDARTQRFLLNRRHLLEDKANGKAELMAQIDHYLPADTTTMPKGITADNATEADTQKMLDVLLDASKRGETMGGRDRHDIARRLLAKRRQATQRDQIEAAVDFLQTWTGINTDWQSAQSTIQHIIDAHEDTTADDIHRAWTDVMMLIKQYDIADDAIIIQPDLARTWDYYTGIVFEIRTLEGLQLAGGGRYDELTRLLGADEDIPAVGYAYYVDHILEILPEDFALKQPTLGLMSEVIDYHQIITWAKALREQGFTVAVGIPGEITLKIDTDGNIQMSDQTYTLNQTKALVSTLSEGRHVG